MIVMLAESRLYSTLYGLQGTKELNAFRKKMRQGREVLVNEGHPVDEYLNVIAAKLPTLRATVRIVSKDEWLEIQDAKRAQKTTNLTVPVSVATPPAGDSDYAPHRKQKRHGNPHRAERRQREKEQET